MYSARTAESRQTKIKPPNKAAFISQKLNYSYHRRSSAENASPYLFYNSPGNSVLIFKFILNRARPYKSIPEYLNVRNYVYSMIALENCSPRNRVTFVRFVYLNTATIFALYSMENLCVAFYFSIIALYTVQPEMYIIRSAVLFLF